MRLLGWVAVFGWLELTFLVGVLAYKGRPWRAPGPGALANMSILMWMFTSVWWRYHEERRSGVVGGLGTVLRKWAASFAATLVRIERSTYRFIEWPMVWFWGAFLYVVLHYIGLATVAQHLEMLDTLEAVCCFPTMIYLHKRVEQRHGRLR